MTKEIDHVVKLAEDTVVYFEETGGKFDPLGFVIAIGEDTFDVILAAKEIEAEVRAMTSDEAKDVLAKLLPLAIRAIKVATKKDLVA